MLSPCCNAYIVLDAHTSDGICNECGRVEEHFHLDMSEQKRLNYALPNCPILIELEDICKNKNVCSSIFNTAKSLYERKKMGTRGQAAHCLYLAFLEHNVPRTYKEISSICQIPVSDITRGIEDNSIIETQPSLLAERVLFQLNIDNKVQVDDIKKKADQLFHTVLTAHPPQSALALAILLLESRTFTIRRIADACNISTQCVRRLVKKYNRKSGIYGTNQV